ncbi:MAG: hypothetical protein WBN89_00620 [Prochlorococcaceae cyanobacterium]
MHPDTLRALHALTVALTEHPADVATLKVYGHIPMHLADVLNDYPEIESIADH